MPEPKNLSAAQTRAVKNTRVALHVEHHHIVWPAQAGDDAEVRLIAGREYQRLSLAVELGELTLEIAVDSQRSVCRSRAGRTGTITLDRSPHGGDHLGMKAEAEVIVRSAHQCRTPADDDLAGPRCFVDDRVEGHRAIAEGAQSIRERLQLIQKAHCSTGVV